VRCGGPVEKLSVIQRLDLRAQILRVECHGAFADVMLRDEQLLRANEISISGDAFGPAIDEGGKA
jgi:hypothetical protein